jgi:5-methylthioadenosine/S-adenosylhomocysteine deaminase
LHADQVVYEDGESLCVGPANVEVQGAFVSQVVPGEAVDGAQVLGRRILAPAFVNGHTHLSMCALRGLVGQSQMSGNVVEEVYFGLETSLTRDDVRAFARLGAWECLLSGTGAVFDHYYYADAVAEALVDVGLCGVVAPTFQDLSGPGSAAGEAAIETTLAIADNGGLREAGVFAAFGPHATDTVSRAAWERLAELGSRHSLPIHAHLSQSFEELERLVASADGDPVSRLAPVLEAGVPLLGVHGIYLSDSELDRLAEADVVLGYCPAAQHQFAFPARVEGWRKRGIGLVLGTDAGVCNDRMDVQAEVRMVATAATPRVTHGPEHAAWRSGRSLQDARQAEGRRATLLTSEEALASVWSTPGGWARGLGVGKIAPGARANMIVVDPSHPALWPGTDTLRALAYGNVAAALEATMINGQLRRLDELRRSDTLTAHLDEANRRREMWLKRAGVDV